MERWFVYTVTLQIFAAIARATEDFRHVSYEGKITSRACTYININMYIGSVRPEFVTFVARFRSNVSSLNETRARINSNFNEIL